MLSTCGAGTGVISQKISAIVILCSKSNSRLTVEKISRRGMPGTCGAGTGINYSLE